MGRIEVTKTSWASALCAILAAYFCLGTSCYHLTTTMSAERVVHFGVGQVERTVTVDISADAVRVALGEGVTVASVEGDLGMAERPFFRQPSPSMAPTGTTGVGGAAGAGNETVNTCDQELGASPFWVRRSECFDPSPYDARVVVTLRRQDTREALDVRVRADAVISTCGDTPNAGVRVSEGHLQ